MINEKHFLLKVIKFYNVNVICVFSIKGVGPVASVTVLGVMFLSIASLPDSFFNMLS